MIFWGRCGGPWTRLYSTVTAGGLHCMLVVFRAVVFGYGRKGSPNHRRRRLVRTSVLADSFGEATTCLAQLLLPSTGPQQQTLTYRRPV